MPAGHSQDPIEAPRPYRATRPALSLTAAIAAAVIAGCGTGGGDADVLSHQQTGLASLLCDPASTNGVLCTAENPPYFLSFAGNFVAFDDDELCYKAVGNAPTGDVRGWKVDPAVSHFDIDGLALHVSSNGRFLHWQSTPPVSVHAMVIKGGNGHSIYNYLQWNLDKGAQVTEDENLHSPAGRNGRIPEISHYNLCYELAAPEGDQGCTPGYWRNHVDRWEGAKPEDLYDTVFGITSSLGATFSLGDAISAKGGDESALARHATAALLNAYGGAVADPSEGSAVVFKWTPSEVVQMVQDAYANGTIAATKDLLATENERGCPLTGTRAQQ
jgi:hypothetical protein